MARRGVARRPAPPAPAAERFAAAAGWLRAEGRSAWSASPSLVGSLRARAGGAWPHVGALSAVWRGAAFGENLEAELGLLCLQRYRPPPR